MAPRPLMLATADGAALAATWFDGEGPPVLLAGALGVPQRFYAPFAASLAARGHRVLTFDLRGMGASRDLLPGRSLRGLEIDMLGWARQDFAAAVDEACGGEGQVTVLGHSLGAHHAVMTLPATQARIRRLVSVAAGSGYWRDWAAPSRRVAPLMLHAFGPLLCATLGWFPGKRLGMVGDLPGPAMRQWSRWCRHPGFAWGAEPALLAPSLAGARFPIHAISFTDDEAMTLDCTRKLLAAVAGAPATIEQISPGDVGVERIGHLGAFRREMEGTLWPRLAERVR